MRKIVLVTLSFLQLQCYGQSAKEIEKKKAEQVLDKTSFKQDVEIFKLEKPLKKTKGQSDEAIYNDYEVVLNSTPKNQELSFISSNIKTSKILSFYYETGEIIFNLYKSNLGNIILLIEGNDYYASNLGVYYIDKNCTSIIEIDDTLVFQQNDPEKLGVKELKGNISKEDNIIICKFYLGDKFLYEKNYEIFTKTETKKNNASENNIVSNNLNQYLNNKAYFIKTFDINKDGIKDKIVSNNPYQGDELLIFLGEDGINFKLVLKTINFSADGGNQIADIKETEQGFNIITLFPDRGSYEENYHIVSKNNTFFLKTLETFSTSWQDSYKETCTTTNIDFNLNKSMRELLNILSKRDKNCVKTKF